MGTQVGAPMRQIPALPRRPEGVELSRTPSDCAPGVRPSPNPRGEEERKTQTAEDEGRAPIKTPLSTNTRMSERLLEQSLAPPPPKGRRWGERCWPLPFAR